MNRLFIAFFIVFLCSGCKHSEQINRKNVPTSELTKAMAEPQLIVYKTRKDYSDLIPIIMNDDRTKIISYPAPSDVFFNGQLAKPTALKNDYLIDNRGISENVVFIDYTYENYSKLSQAPAIEELMERIVDKYPLTKLVYCGARNSFTNEISEVNTLIDANFPNCIVKNIAPTQVIF